MALFKRGQTSNGVAAASEAKAKPTRPYRVLVIGGRGFSADTCAGWGDPRANVTDYDSVLVIPPAEDPGGDSLTPDLIAAAAAAGARLRALSGVGPTSRARRMTYSSARPRSTWLTLLPSSAAQRSSSAFKPARRYPRRDPR